MPWIFVPRGEPPEAPQLDVPAVAALLAALLDGPVALLAAAAIHAATGGNEHGLRALASQTWLAECMERQDGLWRLGQVTRKPGIAVRAGQLEAGQLDDGPLEAGPLEAERITNAAWSAWRSLAPGRADQLCRLALARGVREPIAPIWAMLLILRGQAAQAVSFLRSLPDDQVRTTPASALVMALALVIGTGRVEEASGFLRHAGGADGASFLLAARAWILALAGESGAAAAALAGTQPGGPQTATFVHATRGVLAQAEGRSGEVVRHFRRALAFAESASGDWPWLRPLLRAALIDGLLLSGRTADATSMTQRFHAREPGSGWEFALALESLVMPTRTRPCRCEAA
jgi:hypothetical protein